MIDRILVVCVGNICRSPMAECLLNTELGRQGKKVESAGIGALVDHPAHKFSNELMKERGLDISGHRARQISRDMIDEADLILVMESGHKWSIADLQPAARPKIHRLGEFQDLEIEDPYKLPRSAFIRCLDQISSCSNDWIQRISTNQEQ
jgi:protein-tyrosine phosphatase